MPGLLVKGALTDARRAEHDRHDLRIVVLVLLGLCVYAWLFTQGAESLGIAEPADVAAAVGLDAGLDSRLVFDSDGNVDSMWGISLTDLYDSDTARAIFLLFALLAFLLAYFLPVRYKQGAIATVAIGAVWFLYGPAAVTGIVAAHLVVYRVFHPQHPWAAALNVLVGVLLYLGFLHEFAHPLARLWMAPLVMAAAFAVLHHVVPWCLARERCAAFLRTVTIQSAILTVCISAVIEGLDGPTWQLPLGLLLFFWHWERLIMYQIDHADGQVPADLPLNRYLAVFFTPGQLVNWNWGVSIGQGYNYVSARFLCFDKNRIVLAGLGLWAIALFYLLFWNVIRHALIGVFDALGVPVYRAYTRDLVAHFEAGGEVTTASVLATTFLDLVRWTMMWAGEVHFKVGLWRVCGYHVDPYIQRPWGATNLAVLWSRFTFHYREFLVRAFYYPVFFRVFRKRRYLRTFTAVMAAACIGNLVWGHVPERLYYRGMQFEHLAYVFGTWPYFVLLGIGIGTTQVYLMWRKRRRKPWTLDRWLVTDVIAAWCTLQYFALIHIFARGSPDSSTWDLFRLFALGFGIEIAA